MLYMYFCSATEPNARLVTYKQNPHLTPHPITSNQPNQTNSITGLQSQCLEVDRFLDPVCPVRGCDAARVQVGAYSDRRRRETRGGLPWLVTPMMSRSMLEMSCSCCSSSSGRVVLSLGFGERDRVAIVSGRWRYLCYWNVQGNVQIGPAKGSKVVGRV